VIFKVVVSKKPFFFVVPQNVKSRQISKDDLKMPLLMSLPLS
jgi:hypothetical protein